MRRPGLALLTYVVLVSLMVQAGCLKTSDNELIVYTALDREFSEPILRRFEAESGINVRVRYDTESTKTVGLTSRIIQESKGQPLCDLFWNNEIVNTMRLDSLGLLSPCEIPAADSYPEAFRSPENRWFGFAARARVLLVNTDVVPESEVPDSIYALLDEKWRGKVAIAKPLFGTTATHAVCLFEALGDDAAKAFFRGLVENDVQILSGNKQVAEDVAAGKIAFGLTDTDDAMIELEAGFPVRIVYPDSQPNALGTLFIPNTLCLPKGGSNRDNAQKLLRFLLTPAVETELARGESAQIPLHPDVQLDLRTETPNTIKAMQVDFGIAASRWNQVGQFLKDTLTVVK